LVKWDLFHHNSHAEFTGYQSLEDWKRTGDHQPVHSTDAFANLSSNECWYVEQQDLTSTLQIYYLVNGFVNILVNSTDYKCFVLFAFSRNAIVFIKRVCVRDIWRSDALALSERSIK
jgi:hypothetical protein